MCGNVGLITSAINGFSYKEKQIFNTLLYVDTIRGDDSTGVAAINNVGDVEVLKEASPAFWFQSTKEYQEIMSNLFSKGKAIIGHNRKKTIGAVADDTAHPFVVNNEFVLVHNGTLRTWMYLHKDAKTDSEALANHIYNKTPNGTKEEVEEALGEVDGAYALIWYDLRHNKLFMVRNHERPLYLAETNNNYVWASEMAMLYLAINRENEKIVECKDVPINTLISFDLTKSSMSDMKKEEVLTIVKKSQPSRNYQQWVKTAPNKRGGVNNTENTPSEGGTKRTSHKKGGGNFSKNAFKRFRDEYLGTRVVFYLDDLIDYSPNGAGATRDFLVFGEIENCTEPHSLCVKMHGTQKDIEQSIMENIFEGQIISMEYSKTTQQAAIKIGEFQPLVSPTVMH